MEQQIDHIADTSEMIVIDETEMMLINTETGEIVGTCETPPDEQDTVKLAEWIGDKLTDHGAKLVELQAGKQWQLDRIEALYGPRIKAHEGAIAFLKAKWHDQLYQFAKAIIGDGKKRSCVVGLLKLSLSKSREKTEVLDTEKAVEWLSEQGDCQEAIKVTTTVLVSQIPAYVKCILASNKPDVETVLANTGMVYHPAGETESLRVE